LNKVRIKICGITNKEDLQAAAAFGADAVGFVVGVKSSPRNLQLSEARKLIKLVPLFVNSVVVTINEYRNVQIPSTNFSTDSWKKDTI